MTYIKPPKEEFVPVFQEWLVSNKEIQGAIANKVASALYDVLFFTKLSEFTNTQIESMTEILNGADEGVEGEEVFSGIKKVCPEIQGLMDKIRTHRSLFPKSNIFQVEQMEDIKAIEQSIFDIFNIDTSSHLDTDRLNALLRASVWKPFLQNVRQAQGETVWSFVRDNFDILGYQPSNNSIILSATSEKAYAQIENNHACLRLFKKTIDKVGIKKVEYIVSITPKPLPPKISHKEKPSNYSIAEKMDPEKDRETCYMPEKEVVLGMLMYGKNNLYIQGEEGSGKTHLIQSVVQEYQKRKPSAKLIYTTGEKFMNEYLKKTKLDRESNNQSHKNLQEFRSSCDDAKIFVIDNFDVLGGTKFGTQSVLQSIVKNKGIQLVMVSDSKVHEIKMYKKTADGRPGERDFVPTSVTDIYMPILITLSPLDIPTKEKIARDEWNRKLQNPSLFTDTIQPEAGIMKYLAENISPKIYKSVFDSLELNRDGRNNSNEKIYEIIRNLTGKTLVPGENDIVSVIIEEFQCDEISKYINLKDIQGMGFENINSVYEKKNWPTDSKEGIMLRVCIYFIKKYSKKTFEEIGAKFNRTNCALLYQDASEWLNDKGKKSIGTYLDQQINKFTRKKYGLID